MHEEPGSRDHLELPLEFRRPERENLSALVLGNILHLFWSEGGLDVYHGTFNLLLRRTEQSPLPRWTGSLPRAQLYKVDKLLINYRTTTGAHGYRISGDAMVTVSDEIIADAVTDVVEVDVSVSPLSNNTAFWEETAG